MYMYFHSLIHGHIHTDTHSHTDTDTDAHTDTHTDTHTHTHMHTHSHIHIIHVHIHTHMSTQAHDLHLDESYSLKGRIGLCEQWQFIDSDARSGSCEVKENHATLTVLRRGQKNYQYYAGSLICLCCIIVRARAFGRVSSVWYAGAGISRFVKQAKTSEKPGWSSRTEREHRSHGRNKLKQTLQPPERLELELPSLSRRYEAIGHVGAARRGR